MKNQLVDNLLKLPVRLAKDALPKVVTKATSSPIDQMKEK